MQYYKQVQLNNGELCILRSPNSEDAQAFPQWKVSGPLLNVL